MQKKDVSILALMYSFDLAHFSIMEKSQVGMTFVIVEQMNTGDNYNIFGE